jgi:hypothetical protein
MYRRLSSLRTRVLSVSGKALTIRSSPPASTIRRLDSLRYVYPQTRQSTVHLSQTRQSTVPRIYESADSTLIISYNDGASRFEGGLTGTSITRTVVIRPLWRIEIRSPTRTSRALFARNPFSLTAPASHIS